MTAAEFARLVRNARQRPGSDWWEALCPAHDDHRSSLGFKDGARALILKCQAGCTQAQIATACNIRLADLFHRAPRAERARIVNTYDYRDAEGTLLYQAVRMEPKAFFQRRPDPDHPGAWLTNMTGVTLVPYRFDELSVLRPARVVIVEGEKDANALWDLGIPATTNVAGAGKWRAEYSRALAAAGVHDVVLVPDADLPGYRHMADVLEHSRAAGLAVAWVTLPPLPELPAAKDVSDWLAAIPPASRTLAVLAWPMPAIEAVPPDIAARLGTTGPATAPPGIPPVPDLGGKYAVANGCLAVMRVPKEGPPYPDALCNFDAWILEELQHDNGIETHFKYQVQGRLETGEMLPGLTMAADKYRALGWIDSGWGSQAILHAGRSKAEHLAVAIKLRSRPHRRRVYTHTGWLELGGTPRYLTGSGAVGDAAVEVDIGPLSTRYHLPVAPTRMQEGIAQTLANLKLGNLALTAAITGTLFRAPLCATVDAPYTLYVVGRTGIGKTSLAALMMNHFGDFEGTGAFKYDWASSEGSMRELAFTMKDIVFALDDLTRPNGVQDARQLEAKAAALIRAQANRSGKGRLTSELSQREIHPPRGLLYITAETYVPGESVQARTFTVNARRGDVDFPALTAAMTKRALLAEGMAGYIEWLGPKVFERRFRAQMQAQITTLREQIRAQATKRDAHPRVLEILAHIAVGLEQLLAYAVEVGATGDAEADTLFNETFNALLASTLDHGGDVAALNPTTQFIEALQALLLEGRVCLLRNYADLPNHRGPSIPIGLVRAGDICLDRGAIDRVLELAFRGGFPIPKERLVRELVEERIITPDADGKFTRYVRIAGDLIRMHVFAFASLERVLGHAMHIPGVTDHSGTDGSPGNQTATPRDYSEPSRGPF